MKKTSLFLCVLLLLLGNNTYAQITAVVDERIELVSVVFRLADAKEYVSNRVPEYTIKIDEYFAQYKQHPVVKYVSEIRERYAVGYGTPIFCATHIKIDNNEIGIIPMPYLYDGYGWTENNFNTFVKYLNDFYQETRFSSFFDSHKDLYDVAEKKMSEFLAQKLKPEWFNSFFGKPFGTSVVYIAMANGPHNYAVRDALSPTGHSIVIGVSRLDNNGQPVFSDSNFFTIIHEFTHHFTRPIFEEHWSKIEPFANTIYPYVEKHMWEIGYGSAKVTMEEWLNNLFSIMYFEETDSPRLQLEVYFLQESGFIWMERGIAFMRNFHQNRDLYPYIEDFMPQIVGFLNFIASDFDKVLAEFSRRYPYVVSVYPAMGSNISNPDDIPNDEVRITFSEPMISSNHGINMPEGKEGLPYSERPKYIDDYTFIFKIDRQQLEKNKIYGLKLNHIFFTSQKRYPMAEEFEVTYNTYE